MALLYILVFIGAKITAGTMVADVWTISVIIMGILGVLTVILTISSKKKEW